MANLTVDQLIADLKEIEVKQEELERLGDVVTDALTKADRDLMLLLDSSTLDEDEKARATAATADFISNAMKKSVTRLFKARQQIPTQADIDAAGPGGFPKLA